MLESFDNRDGLIWLDGHLVPWRDAKLHVLTHALHYASSVFEGERAYDGAIFQLEAHTQRLFDSARLMDMIIPWTEAEINTACRDVIQQNGLSNGYVRPIAWRGTEQMGVSAQVAKIHVAITAWDWPSYFPMEKRMQGLRLHLADYRRPDPKTAPCHSKAAGLYMICTLSRHRAEAAGYDDALMLTWRGDVAEGTGANIFFKMPDGKLHTPTPDCFLDGITRRQVIGLAKKAGVEVIERRIELHELKEAEEAFLTGTAVEVTPVKSIGDDTFQPGELSKHLIRAYDELTHAHKAKVVAA